MYPRNMRHYICFVLVFILFLIIPQISLSHWFNSKMDSLEGLCLREFDGTPMIYYFNSDHKSKSVKVSWDVIKNEGVSEVYHMKAQYGLATVRRVYETKNINTAYGEAMKAGLDEYFKDYPNVIINREAIDNKIAEIFNQEGIEDLAIGMDYYLDIDSGKNYTFIKISTYRKADEDHRMVDFIFYSF